MAAGSGQVKENEQRGRRGAGAERPNHGLRSSRALLLLSRRSSVPPAGLTLPTGLAKPAGPVPVYWTGLAENRSKPIEVKFKFKSRSANGSYRLTGRFDRFIGRFDG
jgi:hypothetical protein